MPFQEGRPLLLSVDLSRVTYLDDFGALVLWTEAYDDRGEPGSPNPKARKEVQEALHVFRFRFSGDSRPFPGKQTRGSWCGFGTRPYAIRKRYE